jgi:heme A synthase
VGALYVWHREMALVVLALAAGIGILIWKRHAGERALALCGLAVAGLVAAQIGLGLAMAYAALDTRAPDRASNVLESSPRR